MIYQNLLPMKTLLFSMLFCLVYGFSYAQTDSLIMKNGDVLVGEFKDMNQGVLGIETDYSDSDFKIEWDGIGRIYSHTHFMITTSNGDRYNGTIESMDDKMVKIVEENGNTVTVPLNEIVYLKSVDQGFWSRLYAGIDVGLSLTKSNNFKQITVRGNIGYLAQMWMLDATYNTLNSTQDDTDPIKRTDGGLAFKRFLPHDWYIPVDATFLSNTEQKLDIRVVGKVGAGKYIIHTNSSYWGFAAGVSYVSENFSSDDPDKQSMEMYIGSELNLFDIGDLNLMTKAIAYPGITEKGRWRVDFNFDTKYDLPLDFYIKLGLTLNYDNQPVEGATSTDYVFNTGIGWEW